MQKPLKVKSLLSNIIANGLNGSDLRKDWNEWLATLRDYVFSVNEKSGVVPRRVVITNGKWFVIFIDPADSFLASGSRNHEYIFVYEDWENIENNYTDLFKYLEHQLVLNEKPILTTGELSFHVKPEDICCAMYGLRLMYIEVLGHYDISPAIKIVPLVILRSKYGALLCIERKIEKNLPHLPRDLGGHLADIEALSKNLLYDINIKLGNNIALITVNQHYHDEDIFCSFPGVKEIKYISDSDASKFIIATGENSHYLLKEPKVPNCPYHSWANCKENNCASNPGPIEKRSTKPRSFFMSGENHHCAHADVLLAKASQISPENRSRCGPRSGKRL